MFFQCQLERSWIQRIPDDNWTNHYPSPKLLPQGRLLQQPQHQQWLFNDNWFDNYLDLNILWYIVSSTTTEPTITPSHTHTTTAPKLSFLTNSVPTMASQWQLNRWWWWYLGPLQCYIQTVGFSGCRSCFVTNICGCHWI